MNEMNTAQKLKLSILITKFLNNFMEPDFIAVHVTQFQLDLERDNITAD